MKFYVVSDSVNPLRATAAAMSKALFANDTFLGFKTLEEAQAFAAHDVSPNAENVYGVYEIQVKDDKAGIKAHKSKEIKNAVEITHKSTNGFKVVRAFLNDQIVPVQKDEPAKVAAKALATEVVSKAKAKPAVEQAQSYMARINAFFAQNTQITKAVIIASVGGIAGLAARAAVVSGLVVVTGPVVAAATVAVVGLAAAAYYGPSAYARFKMTKKERNEADLTVATDAVKKLEEALADKTDADKQFIVDLHKFEAAVPAAKFNEDGSDVENQPAITKLHVVQFEQYAMGKLAAAKTDDRANVEKDLLAEAAKKFAPAK